ncbi:MAG: ISKra4 family transposase [Pseudonocardiaceae bacterium]
MAEAAAGAFDRSRQLFEQVVSGLADPGCGELTHAQLEDQLTERSRELMRSLFQDHLDLRASREARRPEGVTGADGVGRARAEKGHQRDLATVFGTVTVTRIAYRAPGAANLYPADAALNLPTGKHSHGLQRLAAIEAARGSFEQAGAALERATGTRVGKRQVEVLAGAAATDVAGFYAQPERAACPDTDLLVLTFDGKGIVMRPEALRDATAKAARATDHKLATRLSPGEKHGRKRMAELAGVYDATPHPRAPGDVISRPGQPRTPTPGPHARGKWLTASITDDIPAVIAAAFDEAERRDPDHRRPWVALVDGNTTQIDAIGAEATRRQVNVTIVLDFIHVLEYLWKAAWSFFYPGDPDAEAWVADQATKILEGNPATVAAGIRRRATRFGYSPSERNGADQAATYLTNKKPYLDYQAALAGGWPIATGIIEGACRHLVKDRMDITGARWGLPGAQAILTLRALVFNGDFDAYWRYHLDQEHHRVHHTRYRGSYQLAA